MTLIRANIQTVNDIYRLVWTAVSKKQPIEARYAGVPDACPHRLGRNRFGERRVLYYQYESKRGILRLQVPPTVAMHGA